jgi:hypothetical protein
MPKIHDALDQYFDKRVPFPVDIAVGKVVSVGTGTIMVNTQGSSSAQPAHMGVSGSVSGGDTCMLIRPVGARQWTIFAVINTPSQGSPNQVAGTAISGGEDNSPGGGSGYQPKMPANPRAGPRIPGILIFVWDTTEGSKDVYKVQVADNKDGTGRLDLLTTQGSYAIIASSTKKFFRVRAISPKGTKTGWTSWIKVKPDGEPDDTSDPASLPQNQTKLVHLVACGEVITCNGECVTAEVPL